MAFVEQGVVRDLRRDVYASYHSLPLRYFQKRKTGDMMSRSRRLHHGERQLNTRLHRAYQGAHQHPLPSRGHGGPELELTLSLSQRPADASHHHAHREKLRRRTTHTQDRHRGTHLGDRGDHLQHPCGEGVTRWRIRGVEVRQGQRFLFPRSFVSSGVRRLSSPGTEFLGVAMVVLVLWIGGSLVLQGRGELGPEEFILYIGFMFMLMQAARGSRR